MPLFPRGQIPKQAEHNENREHYNFIVDDNIYVLSLQDSRHLLIPQENAAFKQLLKIAKCNESNQLSRFYSSEAELGSHASSDNFFTIASLSSPRLSTISTSNFLHTISTFPLFQYPAGQATIVLPGILTQMPNSSRLTAA